MERWKLFSIKLLSMYFVYFSWHMRESLYGIRLETTSSDKNLRKKKMFFENQTMQLYRGSGWYHAFLYWHLFRTAFSWTRSEHTDRNIESLTAPVPFRTNISHIEIFTWCYRKLSLYDFHHAKFKILQTASKSLLIENKSTLWRVFVMHFRQQIHFSSTLLFLDAAHLFKNSFRLSVEKPLCINCFMILDVLMGVRCIHTVPVALDGRETCQCVSWVNLCKRGGNSFTFYDTFVSEGSRPGRILTVPLGGFTGEWRLPTA